VRASVCLRALELSRRAVVRRPSRVRVGARSTWLQEGEAGTPADPKLGYQRLGSHGAVHEPDYVPSNSFAHLLTPASDAISVRYMKRVPITVRLPDPIHAVVEARADREHRSLASALIAILIDEGVGASAGNDGTVLPKSHTQESV
jgi:hypothetical protein